MLSTVRHFRTVLTVAATLVVTVSLKAADIPSDYYTAINNQADSLLKAQLFQICSGGTRVSYGTQGYTYPEGIYYPGSWNYFPLTDRKANDAIWDMYSNTVRYFPNDSGSAGGIQIEHCIPKSWWGWNSGASGSAKRAYQDLYILNPSDAQANGQKSNYPPGHVSKADKFNNGSFRMDKAASSAYGWICFEPAEEYRGDFARTYFYAVTAYQDLPWGAGNKEYLRYLSDSTYLVFQDWLVQVLLDWHRTDPVSRKEIERIDAISTIQGNRNPFIDYPELVEYIWGNKRGQTVVLSQLTCATDTAAYTPQEDYTNFAAYSPSDRTENGFTARWLNFHTDCQLQVYTKHLEGSNDTLLNLPTVTPNILNAAEGVSTIGKLNSAGTSGTVLGSGNTDGGILLRNLHSCGNTSLHFRANIYQTASKGELHIFFNDSENPDTVITLPASRDEDFYHIPVPSGTDSLRLLSVGGSTAKRACLHELYIVQGDLCETQVPLEGFPMHIENTSSTEPFCQHYVTVPASLKGSDIFYRLTTTDNQTSNEVCVNRLPVPENITPIPAKPVVETQKVMRNGVVYILHNNNEYTILGQKN